MLVIKVELWPHGDSERREEIAQMIIANDGTGTSSTGNYFGHTFRKGSAMKKENVIHSGTVKDYPRQRLHVWNLVARMLKSMSYE